jgi:hypothetical protein
MDWKRILDVLTIEDKVLFLEELLEKNERVRSQFLSRFRRESFGDPSLTKASLLRLYDEEKAGILNELEGLNFVDFEIIIPINKIFKIINTNRILLIII